MFCPNCGKELADEKFCPNCGAKIEQAKPSENAAQQQNSQETQPNPMELMPVEPQANPSKSIKISKGLIISLIAIGVVILMIIIGAVSCSIGRSTASKTSSKVTTSSSKSSSYSYSTSTRTYGIGQSVTKNNIKTTLVKVTESSGTSSIKPSTGKKFLICEFKVQNNSTKTFTLSSMLCFDAYCDNIAMNQDFMGLQLNKTKTQLDGKIAPGKTMDGIIVYQVPKSWNTVEINVRPDLSSTSKSTFKFKQ